MKRIFNSMFKKELTSEESKDIDELSLKLEPILDLDQYSPAIIKITLWKVIKILDVEHGTKKIKPSKYFTISK